MTEEKAMEVFEAKILNDPGQGFQSRDFIHTIAKRLMSHTAGRIMGGYRADGKPGGAYEPGNLALKDALYATEYALTRGLNPYGHIHLWYQRISNQPPQLVTDIDYKILKGWAESESPFSTYTLPFGPAEAEAYLLEEGDIGALAYNVLDSERTYLHQYIMMFIQQGKPHTEAQKLAYELVAKSKGVGVVKRAEMIGKKNGQEYMKAAPKGRTWAWRAEIRATRDAIRRSHGEPPPPHKIKQLAQLEGIGINQDHIAILADKSFPAALPADIQSNYLQLEARAQEQKAGAPPQHDMKLVSRLMYGDGDADPLELSPEEPEAEAPQPPPPEPPPIEVGEVEEDSQPEEDPDERAMLDTINYRPDLEARALEVFGLKAEDMALILKNAGFKRFSKAQVADMWGALKKAKMPQKTAMEAMFVEDPPSQYDETTGEWKPATLAEFILGCKAYFQWEKSKIKELLAKMGYEEYKPELAPEIVRKLEAIRDTEKAKAAGQQELPI